MIGRELRGRCGRCEAVFTIARLPMALSKAARLMSRASCPFCGSKRPIYLATEENTQIADLSPKLE